MGYRRETYQLGVLTYAKYVCYSLCMSQPKGIGAKIAEARHAAGLSQRELAEGIGASQRAVQSWELEARHPRLDKLHALAKALGHDVAWFYSEQSGTKAAA